MENKLSMKIKGITIVMEKDKVGVIILNYRAFKETIECVESFKKQSYPHVEIVVVENGSQNESAKFLQNAFKGERNIHIIISNVNLGFAKGNNLGIQYARKELGCKDVVVINSDTVVQPTIIEELVSAKEKNVALLSPTVINLNGQLQQPSENAENMPREIARVCKNIFVTSIINSKFFTFLKRKNNRSSVICTNSNKLEVKAFYLQGCSYMLTEEFFKHYTGLYPETFLYWEELNLLWYVYKAGLKTKYVSTSPVLHKVAVSTGELLGLEARRKKKEKLVYGGMRKSIPLYFMSYAKIRDKYN